MVAIPLQGAKHPARRQQGRDRHASALFYPWRTKAGNSVTLPAYVEKCAGIARRAGGVVFRPPREDGVLHAPARRGHDPHRRNRPCRRRIGGTARHAQPAGAQHSLSKGSLFNMPAGFGPIASAMPTCRPISSSIPPAELAHGPDFSSTHTTNISKARQMSSVTRPSRLSSTAASSRGSAAQAWIWSSARKTIAFQAAASMTFPARPCRWATSRGGSSSR